MLYRNPKIGYIRKRQCFQQIVLENLSIHMQKHETRYFYFTIYKTSPNPKGKNLTIWPDSLTAKRKSREYTYNIGIDSNFPDMTPVA